MKVLAMEALSAYIVACVVGASSVFTPFRAWFKMKTVGTMFDKKPLHFIECRLCLSLWAACGSVAMFSCDLTHVLPVYGLAYFAATQERR